MRYVGTLESLQALEKNQQVQDAIVRTLAGCPLVLSSQRDHTDGIGVGNSFQLLFRTPSSLAWKFRASGKAVLDARA